MSSISTGRAWRVSVISTASLWCWWRRAMESMRVRYFSWSRLVLERSAVKVKSGAWGLVVGTGFRSLWAFRMSFRVSLRSSAARSPAGVLASLWSWWMRSVCSRDSSTVKTRQRFMSSSSMSMLVVVRRMAQGPSTWYSCVSMRPLCGSLPVLAMVSSPSDWRSLRA